MGFKAFLVKKRQNEGFGRLGLSLGVVPGEVVALVEGDGLVEFFGVFGDVAVGDGVAFGLGKTVFAELGIDGVTFVADFL